MAWLCNNCGVAHADGRECPYLGLTPRERRLVIVEEQLRGIEKRLTSIEDIFKAIRNL